MQLKIKQAEKVSKPTNVFEIEIEFMEGDADGKQFHNIMIDKPLMNDPNFSKEMEDFLMCITECVKKDRKGRCGFQEASELISEYCSIKNWAKYCLDVLENLDEVGLDEDSEDDDFIEELNISKSSAFREDSIIQKFQFYMPSNSDGWYTSFRKLNVYYYDLIGDKCPVEVIF